MASRGGIVNQPNRIANARGKLRNRGCRLTALILVFLLAGCTAEHTRSGAMSATSPPSDVTCAHCTMKHYVWDSRAPRFGTLTHHDIWNMECPDCVVRMSGIWLFIGPSHTCGNCPAGVNLCPMCRAADRDDGKYPTTQPAGVSSTR